MSESRFVKDLREISGVEKKWKSDGLHEFAKAINLEAKYKELLNIYKDFNKKIDEYPSTEDNEIYIGMIKGSFASCLEELEHLRELYVILSRDRDFVTDNVKNELIRRMSIYGNVNKNSFNVDLAFSALYKDMERNMKSTIENILIFLDSLSL